MFSKVSSAAINGIDGFLVQVEADVSDGLPVFDMVGYLASEVKEARERVRISLKNSGYHLLPKRITVNLAPADVRKEGTAFDLPIAVAILISLGFISQDSVADILIAGELSLNGKVNGINGVLPIVFAAKEMGLKQCILPSENAKEGAVVQDIDIIGVKNLNQVVEYLNGQRIIEPEYVDVKEFFHDSGDLEEIDFADIIGQSMAKRAIEVAVTGMHNILMLGSPGAGKSMLAKRIPTIMPKLTMEESLEISKIYSVSGLLDKKESLVLKRPFRSPHHTVTTAALTGGGRNPVPGEISLANGGVLFLDELPEFNKNTIEILRQPLEEKSITISRVQGVYSYPANIMLVAAMNPCKCGYFPDRNRCNCSLPQIKRYLGSISGPLLDRIDICIETIPIAYKEMELSVKTESSSAIRKRVMMARNVQAQRYREEGIRFNSDLNSKGIDKYCSLGTEEKKLIEKAYFQYGLSARGYHRILKVARTIADLDGAENIGTVHLSEAICYRSLEGKYWREVI